MSDNRLYSVGNRVQDIRKLWDRFVEGDLDAWEQIFSKYYEDLYGYGIKFSSQRELTKDCIHELFVILWERKEHLANVNSVKAYLLVSLRRNLHKKLKKRQKYYKDKENPAECSTDIQFSPEVILIRDEVEAKKIESLYKALDQLPVRQKEVLYLKYFNGLNYDEIEEVLSIKNQSIKNHIYRAVSKLKEIMGDDITKIAISLIPLLLLF